MASGGGSSGGGRGAIEGIDGDGLESRAARAQRISEYLDAQAALAAGPKAKDPAPVAEGGAAPTASAPPRSAKALAGSSKFAGDDLRARLEAEMAARLAAPKGPDAPAEEPIGGGPSGVSAAEKPRIQRDKKVEVQVEGGRLVQKETEITILSRPVGATSGGDTGSGGASVGGAGKAGGGAGKAAASGGGAKSGGGMVHTAHKIERKIDIDGRGPKRPDEVEQGRLQVVTGPDGKQATRWEPGRGGSQKADEIDAVKIPPPE